MLKSSPKRLILAKETLRELADMRMRRVAGGAPTQIITDCTCTTEYSYCTN